MFEKVINFLERQKEEMLRLDRAERLEREGEFSVIDTQTGRRKGVREILYDNTIRWIISESDRLLFSEFLKLSQPNVLNETTLTADIAAFTTALLPVVRRVYSRLLLMELVSVQPLNGPSGYIVWLDHEFGTTGGGATKGQRLDRHRHPNYATTGEAEAIREIDLKVKKKLIETTTKKLKATWTLEAQQDLSSQWKLDLWAELLPELTNEIAREIDTIGINALLAGAGFNVNWNANGYRTDDKSTWERRQYDRTIYSNGILVAATEIFKKKYVYPNWLLMNGDTFLRIQRLEEFSADPTVTPDQQTVVGWRYEGTLANKFKVYVDPWFAENKILVGFKGADWKYAVGVYCPYIPVFLSEEYIVNDDFTQRGRGAMTRYYVGVIPEDDSAQVVNHGLATVTITQS